MNIVLIGMRGSGKTVVGKLLADKLRKEFVDLDVLITTRSGRSIPEIVQQSGWDRFRDIEEEITHEAARKDNTVIATGGGVVARQRNIEQLEKQGKLFWLQVGLDTLLERIGDDPARPSLTGKPLREDMATILSERTLIYEQAADFIIDTESKTPEEVTEEISKIWTEHGWK